jgi:hypothetical protein
MGIHPGKDVMPPEHSNQSWKALKKIIGAAI